MEASDVAERLEMSTAEIGLSVRTTNCLEERGIFTVNDLLNSTRRGPVEHFQFRRKDVGRSVQGPGGDRLLSAIERGRRPACRQIRLAASAPAVIDFGAQLSDSTRRNAATGGPVPGCSAASARPSSSPSFWSGAAPGWSWGFVTLVMPEWRVNHEFVAHTCTVLGKRIVEDPGDAALCRPEVRIQLRGRRRRHADPGSMTSTGTYSSSRQERRGRAGRLCRRTGSIPAGMIRPGPRWRCWCGATSCWNWLVLIVPLSFVAIGGGGLVFTVLHWGTSVESRAARLRRTPRDLLSGRRGRRGGPARRARPRRHHQQSGDAAGLPAAHEQLAGLGAAWPAAGLPGVERPGVGVRGAGHPRLPGAKARLAADGLHRGLSLGGRGAGRALRAATAHHHGHRSHAGGDFGPSAAAGPRVPGVRVAGRPQQDPPPRPAAGLRRGGDLPAGDQYPHRNAPRSIASRLLHYERCDGAAHDPGRGRVPAAGPRRGHALLQRPATTASNGSWWCGKTSPGGPLCSDPSPSWSIRGRKRTSRREHAP